jgi:hypothetical protein
MIDEPALIHIIYVHNFVSTSGTSWNSKENIAGPNKTPNKHLIAARLAFSPGPKVPLVPVPEPGLHITGTKARPRVKK